MSEAHTIINNIIILIILLTYVLKYDIIHCVRIKEKKNMYIIITLFLIYSLIMFLPNMLRTWSDMDYIKQLEDMGVFVDKNGKEI